MQVHFSLSALLIVVALALGLAAALSGKRRGLVIGLAMLMLLVLGGAVFLLSFRARLVRDFGGVPSLQSIRPVPNTSLALIERDDRGRSVVDIRPSPATQTSPSTMASTKRWVDDWVGWVNSAGRGTAFLRAVSTGPCISEPEAREQAIAQAARELKPIVLSQLVQNLRTSSFDNALLEAVITDALRSGRLIVDQYLTRTNKPYGSLWTCYLLIDRSPLALDPVVQRVYKASQAHVTLEKTKWLSIAALAAVIVLLYAFLNAATKGYFVWRLRSVALLIAIAAVLAVMAMA